MIVAVQTTPTRTPSQTQGRRLLGKVALALAVATGLALLLLLLAGVFTDKVPSTEPPLPSPGTAGSPVAEVRLVRRPRYETAVGTVRAVHEAAIASRLLAQVTEVRVKAGQPVSQGDILVRLDDSDLKARLKQAEATVVAAQSARDKTESDYQRALRLFRDRALSRGDVDHANSAWQTAAADLVRAQQAVREAKVLLDFTTVRAPLTGVVIDKRVEVGDTASPGQVLLTLLNPDRMQMIVSVRESLAQRLAVGQKVRGRLEALNRECEATISEIVPESRAASRSFTVKVIGPCPPGAYSGMFGRIYIPLDEEETVVVPAAAVRHIGQLDMVEVAERDGLRRRSVQLGRHLNGDWEVLAGLRPGERVVLPPSQAKEVQP